MISEIEVSVKSISMDAVVIRKNGYREDLGRIAYWDRSLWKRLQWRFQRSRDGQLFVVADPVAGLITAIALPFLATLQVNTGRAIVTARLIGATPSQAEPKYMAWGTGTGTTAAADTTLFFETFTTTNDGTHNIRPNAAFTQVTTSTTNDTAQNQQTLTAAQGQNGTQGTLTGPISNAGLFDSNGQAAGLTQAPSGGNLYMKGDFAIINLSSGDSIQFTNKVQYS